MGARDELAKEQKWLNELEVKHDPTYTKPGESAMRAGSPGLPWLPVHSDPIEQRRAGWEALASTLGSIGGGALTGLATGGPVGAAVGGVAGAVSGAMLTRAAMEGDLESPAVTEAAKRALAGEAIGQAVAPGIGAVGGVGVRGLARVAQHPVARYVPGLQKLGGFARRLTGPSEMVEPGAADVQRYLLGKGSTLRAGQASSSTTIDILDNVARGSFLGRPPLEQLRLRNYNIIKQDIDEFAKTIVRTSDPQDRARIIQGALDEQADAFWAHAGAKWENLDEYLKTMGTETRGRLLSDDLVFRGGAREESIELLSPQVVQRRIPDAPGPEVLSPEVVVRRRTGERVPAQTYLVGGPKEFVPEPEGAAHVVVRRGAPDPDPAVHMLLRRPAQDPDSVVHMVLVEKSAPRVVDIRPMKAWAHEQISSYRLHPPPSWLSRLADEPEDFLTFREAHNLRREIGSSVPDPAKVPSYEGGQFAKAYKLINERMEAAAEHLPPGALSLYREASDFTREGVETYQNRFIRSLINNEQPEVLYEAAVKNQRPTHILKLRKVLRERDDFDALWQDIQGQWFNDVLRKAQPDPKVPFDADVALREINSLGPAAERALFGANGLKYPRFLFEAMQMSQKEAGQTGVGGMAIQLTQAGAAISLSREATRAVAAGGLIGGGATLAGADPSTSAGLGIGGAATIILGPAAIAKAFRDPRFVTYLTEGMKHPIGSKAAAKAFGQILARADKLGVLDKPIAALFGQPETVEDRQTERARTAQTAGDILRQRIADKQRQMNPLGGGR